MAKEPDDENSPFAPVDIMTRAQIEDLHNEVDWTEYEFDYVEGTKVEPDWRTVFLLDERQISYSLIPEKKKCFVFDSSAPRIR